jgi:hypothetical protein
MTQLEAAAVFELSDLADFALVSPDPEWKNQSAENQETTGRARVQVRM